VIFRIESGALIATRGLESEQLSANAVTRPCLSILVTNLSDSGISILFGGTLQIGNLLLDLTALGELQY
jgi:hypothetical protein